MYDDHQMPQQCVPPEASRVVTADSKSSDIPRSSVGEAWNPKLLELGVVGCVGGAKQVPVRIRIRTSVQISGL